MMIIAPLPGGDRKAHFGAGLRTPSWLMQYHQGQSTLPAVLTALLQSVGLAISQREVPAAADREA